MCRISCEMRHMPFQRWPDIGSLAHVRKTLQLTDVVHPDAGYLQPREYRAKIKLHGTNAAIRHEAEGGILVAQSRTRDLSVANDHFGFARWVYDYDRTLKHWLPSGYTAFGEWFGRGINKSTLQTRHLAVFALLRNGTEQIITNPAVLSELLPTHRGIHVLPYYGDPITLDWHNLGPIAERIGAAVDEVEACDPWIKQTFGFDCVGEGLVFYPTAEGPQRFSELETFMFKAKGEKHAVQKTKTRVPIEPEVQASIDEFVANFVTPARLDQGIEEIGAKTMRDTGKLLKWVSQDVQKESGPELEASGLTWTQVRPAVETAARTAWKARVDAV